jgi:hemerythrin superfamily protein
MNAIRLLKEQHRLVEELHRQFEASDDDGDKKQIFFEIADNLAVHATIEERFFYPAVRARQTEEQLEESYDEHLEVKRLTLQAMDSTEEAGFDGRVAALMGALEHHVEEEEGELFPKVEQLMTREALEALGQRMEAEAADLLDEGAPRLKIRVEIEAPGVQP